MATTNAQYITDVVKYTNQERQKAGLPPLTVNSLLNKAAQTHSQNMALQDFYSSWDKDGKWYKQRIEATGYDGNGYEQENISTGQKTPKQVVNGWINNFDQSRYNIFNPATKEIGVGYYYLENDTGQQQSQYYWTQDFASPYNPYYFAGFNLVRYTVASENLTGTNRNDLISYGDIPNL